MGFIASFLLQKVLFSDGSCVPKPQKLRRFVISPLSARLCLFLLSLPSFQKIFPKFFAEEQDRPQRITLLCRLCGFDGIFRLFRPGLEKAECFMLSCFLSLFFSVFSSLFQPVLFRFFLPLRSSRCFSLLFALFLGRFFAFCASRVIFRGVFLFFFRFSCFFLVSGALPSLFRCAFGVVSAFCVLRVILRCAFLLWVHFLRISGSFWARFS